MPIKKSSNLDNLTEAQLATLVERWARSFVEWSQSPYGFYVDRRWDRRRNRWDSSRYYPIEWAHHQQRVFGWAFTFNKKGELPVDRFYYIDTGQSGKSTAGAALSQWLGMWVEKNSAIQLAANSKDQSASRVYALLKASLENHPYRQQIVDIIEEQRIVFAGTHNEARPIPLNAATQAGGSPVGRVIDEVHAWEWKDQAARKMAEELKPTPARSTSLLFVPSYPSYAEVDGYLNDVINDFLDEYENPKEGVHKVKGLEDLPLWVKGRNALWWNHNALLYPWVTPEFLNKVRADPAVTENQFRRIWAAERVSSETTFMPMEDWDGCEDQSLNPLDDQARGVPMCIGVDIGIKRDHSGVTARGYEPSTLRYPLYAHRHWKPSDFTSRGRDVREVVGEVEQWVLNMHLKHDVLAVFYDPHEFQDAALRLKHLGVRIMELSQNGGRDFSDPNYQRLIKSRRLRNYPQSGDLRDHVRNVVGIDRETGIRMQKSKSGNQKIDLAVADAMACHAVTVNEERFRNIQRRKYAPPAPPRRSRFASIFGLTGN
jgi:phage terminase large subunit-like protein